MIDRVTTNLYQCCKCGYQWTSWNNKKKAESPVPRYCPKCKNVRWNQHIPGGKSVEYSFLSKLQEEHIIRQTINPYKSYIEKINEYDFIAYSFFFSITPPPQMFELKQLSKIPISELEKRHEFMLSIINDRIRNKAKYEKEYHLKEVKYLHEYLVSANRRRIMKGCNHKPIPEIEEALYHVTQERERCGEGAFYDMWYNPTN